MFTARPRANEIDFRADSSDIEFCVFDYKKSSSWDVVFTDDIYCDMDIIAKHDIST